MPVTPRRPTDRSPGRPGDGNAFARLRSEMVEEQIAARGISDERVLDAMRAVPREMFVPAHLRELAYEDAAVPIEEGQTISQPFIVAMMAEGLCIAPEDRVLEVGTGSGYAAAVFGSLAREIFTIERHPRLVKLARERLTALGYDNVRVRQGNGTAGWPEHAPYDAISVAAAGPSIAQPLLDQLGVGGRIIMPVGPSHQEQELVRITKIGEARFDRESLGPVQFVPLVGEQGWGAGD